MPKNIVVCCDGTGNEFGRNNTNVVDLFNVIEKDSPKQIAFYDPGVGTAFNTLKKGIGGAFGGGITKNIEDAYEYLMNRYEEGDTIYLFGFSRGAFTVRSLAGMLYKCGLLQKGSSNQIEYATKVYSAHHNEDIAAGFKKTFSRKCPVYFVGVWDTVGSLGWVLRRKFHNTRLNPEVTYAYQAISIDEKRGKFPPSIWDEESIDKTRQTVEQVWFAGVHSDVGGWYDERGLSNIALRWMIGKAEQCGLRVILEQVNRIAPSPHDVMHESYQGPWRLLGKKIREIPDGAIIHQSVFDRIGHESNKYNPINLPQNCQKTDTDVAKHNE